MKRSKLKFHLPSTNLSKSADTEQIPRTENTEDIAPSLISPIVRRKLIDASSFSSSLSEASLNQTNRIRKKENFQDPRKHLPLSSFSLSNKEISTNPTRSSTNNNNNKTITNNYLQTPSFSVLKKNNNLVNERLTNWKKKLNESKRESFFFDNEQENTLFSSLVVSVKRAFLWLLTVLIYLVQGLKWLITNLRIKKLVIGVLVGLGLVMGLVSIRKFKTFREGEEISYNDSITNKVNEDDLSNLEKRLMKELDRKLGLMEKTLGGKDKDNFKSSSVMKSIIIEEVKKAVEEEKDRFRFEQKDDEKDSVKSLVKDEAKLEAQELVKELVSKQVQEVEKKLVKELVVELEALRKVTNSLTDSLNSSESEISSLKASLSSLSSKYDSLREEMATSHQTLSSIARTSSSETPLTNFYISISSLTNLFPTVLYSDSKEVSKKEYLKTLYFDEESQTALETTNLSISLTESFRKHSHSALSPTYLQRLINFGSSIIIKTKGLLFFSYKRYLTNFLIKTFSNKGSSLVFFNSFSFFKFVIKAPFDRIIIYHYNYSFNFDYFNLLINKVLTNFDSSSKKEFLSKEASETLEKASRSLFRHPPSFYPFYLKNISFSVITYSDLISYQSRLSKFRKEFFEKIEEKLQKEIVVTVNGERRKIRKVVAKEGVVEVLLEKEEETGVVGVEWAAERAGELFVLCKIDFGRFLS